MKRAIFIFFLLIFGNEALAAPTVRYVDLRALVETKNERVKAKEKEHSAAELRQGSLLRSFLPRVEIYGAQEKFKKGRRMFSTQPAYGAEATVNLFNAGRDRMEESRRKLVTERKVHERKLTMVEELANAREQYWEILFLRDALLLRKEAQELNQKNLGAAERRIKSGVSTEVDRVDFEMKSVELKQENERAELELRNEKALLALSLGMDGDTEMTIPDKLDHDHNLEEALSHEAKDHEFLLLPRELAIEEINLAARAEGRSYWPKLDVYAGWNQFNEREEDPPLARDRTETVFGLKLSLNIFDGFASRREAAALNMEADAASLELAYLRRESEAHIHNEITELKLLHGQVHEAESNTKRALRYYSLTQSEYGRGVKNSPDVLGAAEKLFQTKLKHIAIIRDFQIAKAHVLSKMGR